MRQTFRAPVDSVAGRDAFNFNVEQVSITIAGEAPPQDSPSDCIRTRRRLVAVRAELWRMFFRKVTGLPYVLLAWLGFGMLITAFWGHARPIPHAAVLLGWGAFVIVPATWIMGRARDAMFDELVQVRRELHQVERRLVRAEAERRALGTDSRNDRNSGGS